MPSGNLTIRRLLEAMKELDASDLHIKVGIPPVYRINGELRPVQADPVGEDDADHLFDPILTDELKQRFERTGNCDFAWHLPSRNGEAPDRFRINLLRSGNHLHAAVRRVKADIPSYASLHLPAVYEKIVAESNEGLVLVVGVTGSGKSTTLAAMIEQINRTEAVNIITVEDPIEYRFTPKKAIISQREIGIDVESFPVAMKYVVRQDPDVIFVGEMRDKETIISAIQAAETGHLVFATLHTADTMQAFGRMLEFFPQEERGFIRNSLAVSLRAICAQRLMPATPESGAGVVPATEVLLNNPTVRDKIRDGEDADLPAIIAGSTADGMHNFTQALAEMLRQDLIDMSTALRFAPNREALQSVVRGLQVKSSTLVHRIKAHA